MTTIVARLVILVLFGLSLSAVGGAYASDSNDEESAMSSLAKLYCGRDNCYDILGIPREATVHEIKRAYRGLARVYHPDKQSVAQDAATREEAQMMFIKIAKAYEVLSNPKLREAYDLYIDYPEYAVYNYYNYYNAVYKPQTPYLNDSLQYKRVTNAVRRQRQFQQRVKDRLVEAAGSVRALRKMEDADREQLEREVEKSVFEEEVQLNGSGSKPADIHRTIGYRFLRSPMSLAEYMVWRARWTYRFGFKKEEYGPEEREYLTRRALKLSEENWHMVDDAEREQLLEKRLYEGDNLQQYLKEKEREERSRLEKSGAYKRYQRIKRAGPTSYNYNED